MADVVVASTLRVVRPPKLALNLCLSLTDCKPKSNPLLVTSPAGLSVHMNQVHKESLEHVENALSNRQGLDYEIFGMEGMPSEIFETHQQRLSQNYYEAQEKRRIVTGNPLPGQARQPSAKKKITIETEEELKRRLAEWRKTRVNVPVDAMEGVVLTSVCALFSFNGGFEWRGAFEHSLLTFDIADSSAGGL